MWGFCPRNNHQNARKSSIACTRARRVTGRTAPHITGFDFLKAHSSPQGGRARSDLTVVGNPTPTYGPLNRISISRLLQIENHLNFLVPTDTTDFPSGTELTNRLPGRL